jgi:hypothetical protein
MATEYDIYIETDESFSVVVRKIEDILDIKLITQNDQPWSSAHFSAIGFRIGVTGDLDYEDDMGIKFSKYSYQISIDTYTRVSVMEYWSELEYYLALTIYQRICDKLDWKCMVTEDGQKLVIHNDNQRQSVDVAGFV